MATRGGGRMWKGLLSCALMGAAVGIIVATLVTDSPDKDSGNRYFLAVFLAFAGMAVGEWARRHDKTRT